MCLRMDMMISQYQSLDLRGTLSLDKPIWNLVEPWVVYCKRSHPGKWWHVERNMGTHLVSFAIWLYHIKTNISWDSSQTGRTITKMGQLFGIRPGCFSEATITWLEKSTNDKAGRTFMKIKLLSWELRWRTPQCCFWTWTLPLKSAPF